MMANWWDIADDTDKEARKLFHELEKLKAAAPDTPDKWFALVEDSVAAHSYARSSSDSAAQLWHGFGWVSVIDYYTGDERLFIRLMTDDEAAEVKNAS